jgi:hypothetical protein
MNAPIARDPLASEPMARPRESYADLLERLSALSVRKCHDPYVDIAWDTPESAVDPRDSRHAIDPRHPLAQSDWYAALDADTRARFGLAWTAQ